MLKFAKIAVLFIFISSLIGCSNVPEGISKEQYNEATEIVKIINEHYQNNLQLNEDLQIQVDNYISKITDEKFTPSSEEEKWFLMDVYNVYSYYNFYLLYTFTEDDDQLNTIKNKYMNTIENLKTKYNIEF